jgi:hypothetical protein
MLLALATIAAGCGGDPNASLDPAPPADVAMPSAAAATVDEFGAIAWWETQNIGFGVIPEMPDPDPPVNPGGFRQLAVGTLDGRVTALLDLHWDWSHSSVSGPYGDDVLVANDTGSASEVFLISASEGTRTDLFETDAIVAAAAIGDGGSSIYYVELDRETLHDSGLWRRPLDGGPPEQVVAEPFRDDFQGDIVNVYWITADPLVGRVVVQWCHGQVACDSFLVVPATGEVRERIEPGWPLGADGTTFFGDSLASGGSAWAWDVGSDTIEGVPGAERTVPVRTAGGWRFVRDALGVPEGPSVMLEDGREVDIPGDDPPMTTLAPLGEQHGVGLRPGWVLRWPFVSIWGLIEDKPPEAQGQLIEIPSGRREPVPIPELNVDAGVGCDVLAPSEMPSGRSAGSGVLNVLDGRRTVRWGSGDDRVVLAVGWDPFGDLPEGEPAEIRGQPATAILIGDESVGEVAVRWEEGGCTYVAWLPAGWTLEQAREYAGRY